MLPKFNQSELEGSDVGMNFAVTATAPRVEGLHVQVAV
jgi:hypothetical protein